MSYAEWAEDSRSGLVCMCRCHGTVEFNEAGQLMQFLNIPPRYGNARAWAESCDKCAIEHWIAASVHDHVTSMEADIIDDANSYLAHFITNKERKA